jgi:2-desacetyl-2-hydroxyethyl bacteriochlorophyllide A dehydrogenase
MDDLCRALVFQAPYQLFVVEEPVPQPGPGQVRVRALASAISAGSELLFYRGQVPAGMASDATLAGVGGAGYPLRYGYALAGAVEALGPDVAPHWLGRRVFAFQPHASHFVAAPESLLPIPAGLAPEQATLLPNMETAVSLVMDGTPVIGERVALLGLGVVGQLTTRLLAEFPLARLVAADGVGARRTAADGANVVTTVPEADGVRAALGVSAADDGADLVYELSGNPAALDLALAVVGHHGRIIVGSWYGTKQAALDLGGRFHRSHVTLQSSQVSHLGARWLGRWSKARRLDVAWAALQRLQPTALMTHRFALKDAAAAFALLDRAPAEALQIIFTY